MGAHGVCFVRLISKGYLNKLRECDLKFLSFILTISICLCIACGAKNISDRLISSANIGRLERQGSVKRPAKNLSQKKWDLITKESEKVLRANYKVTSKSSRYQIYSYRLLEDDLHYIVSYVLSTAGPNIIEIYLTKDKLEVVQYMEGFLCW